MPTVPSMPRASGWFSRLQEIPYGDTTRARAPEDLIGLWLGHTRRTVTDLYASGLQQDTSWRREWCDRVGLGFAMFGLHGLQTSQKLI